MMEGDTVTQWQGHSAHPDCNDEEGEMWKWRDKRGMLQLAETEEDSTVQVQVDYYHSVLVPQLQAGIVICETRSISTPQSMNTIIQDDSSSS